jgi:hypothetical protein
MNYENCIEHVNLAEQLTTSDLGVSTGLSHQGYWESSKWYFVSVERGNDVAIDPLLFIPDSDQMVIDVETGIILTKIY